MSKKRPSHESDAMALFLSDSAVPKVVEKLNKLEEKGLRGDQLFAAVAIALSFEGDPEFWKRFSDVMEFENAVLEYLETLRKEGKPVPMSFLRQVQQRYSEEIKPYSPKQWEIWRGAFDILLFEFKNEKYIVVKRRGEFEFEIPVE
jgi:hypothetical protein